MKALALAALALSLSSPAAAWSVRAIPGACVAETEAPSGATLFIRGERSGEMTFHLHNPDWWAVGEGSRQNLGIRFDQSRVRPVKGTGTDGSPNIGGGVWFVIDEAFLRDLAKANRVYVTRNGNPLSNVPLHGSGKAMADLASCLNRRK